MRTNKSGVTEVAHVRSYGSKSYEDNWEHIFGKKDSVKNTDSANVSDPSCSEAAMPVGPSSEATISLMAKAKEFARKSFIDLESGQDTEGFPESASYIYGFMKGYEKALKDMGKE